MDKTKLMTEIIEWAKSLAFALAVGAIIIVFARPSLIIGPSMEPTFNGKNLVLVEKVSYFISTPKRGDIVVAQTELPLNRWMNKSVIKRIIGLPGDEIKIENGKVYINNELYEEIYLKDGFTDREGIWTVPQEHVFLMGDNRAHSNDSRGIQVGYVPLSKLKGKVYLRIFPFDQIKSF